jgi:prolyl-tRNA synthetase
MMGDKRALQAATSHNLGQNFAKAFEIKYLDRNNELQYCWTTSWGMSTRIVGAIVMVHGDDQGLILPPRLAPVQAVVVPIWKSDQERSAVLDFVQKIKAALGEKVRLKVDDREGLSPGWKFNEWELRGVPLRIEVGPRDVAGGQVMLARRDRPGRAGKSPAPLAGLAETVADMLVLIQKDMLAAATAFRDANTHLATDYESFKEIVGQGFARAWWCGSIECEDKIKEETKATTRNIPFDQPGGSGVCIVCGQAAKEMAIFARAY